MDDDTSLEILYSRSGGIAGMQDRLTIQDQRTIQVSDRSQQYEPRALTAEEASSLEALLGELGDAPEPARPTTLPVPDGIGWSLTLEVGDERSRHAEGWTAATPTGDDAWGRLLGWLDQKLTDELSTQRGSGVQLLAVDGSGGGT